MRLPERRPSCGAPTRARWLLEEHVCASGGALTMHTAALRLELRIRDVASLKAKRHVVKSLRANLVRSFGVAVAEVDHLDKWQRATLGVATVAATVGQADRVLHTVRTTIGRDPRVEILDYAVGYLERPE